MQLHPLDLAIIGIYLVLTVFIGFWISRRASRSMESYFLGGKQISWQFLGLSNASGMFDISGTMLMVYWLFTYGLKSIWIPWLWPVFNQIFLMAYLSIWLRRSGAMTGAEWIRFRFGDGPGAQWSHIVVVVFALINVISFLAYGFIGIGKFAAVFFPWALHPDPVVNYNLYGLIISALTTLYVVKGGMFSVVFTEVLQFAVMTVACIAVGVIAMQQVSPEMLAAVVPADWGTPFFGWELGLNWSEKMPALESFIEKDGWSLFGAFWMMQLFKGYLISGAGPVPNYDMQRVLSTQSPSDAARMSAFVNVVLLIPRYMLIAGLTVLALVFFSDSLKQMGAAADFEQILPFAIQRFIPPGISGLLLAGLLAAFMSTYAATVNAAPAYLVNDIYKRYFRPDAPAKTYVRLSYLVSVLVVLVGTGFGFLSGSLNSLVSWIVTALYGSYTASNVLKWYWWRFNSYGYFGGMAAGLLASLIQAQLLPAMPGFWVFPFIFSLSLAAGVGLSLLTPPDSPEVLKRFYLRVRPWGFWGPVYRQLLAEHPGLEPNRSFARDMLNVAVGIVWQSALTAAGIFLVIQDFFALGICAALILLCSLWLKYRWYDRLEDWPQGVEA